MELFSDILDVLNTTLNESVKKKKKDDEPFDPSCIKKMNIARLNITYKESAKALIESLSSDCVIEQDEFRTNVKMYKYMLRNPRTDSKLKQNVLKSMCILFYIYFKEDGMWIEELNKTVSSVLSEKDENCDSRRLHSSIKDTTVLQMLNEFSKSRSAIESNIQNLEKSLHQKN